MTAEEFVAAWRREKSDLLAQFTNAEGTSLVAQKLRELRLPGEQRQQVADILDAVLTDTFYTLLLGLDGSASIGGTQHTYKIQTDDGALISKPGEIEAEAWKAFHGQREQGGDRAA